jgi:dihydroneopterin aldolase
VRVRLHKIYIKDLKVRAIIGILDFEREKEQLIVANIVIKYKKSKKMFINYVDVTNLIDKMLKNNKYGLIEDAIDDIIDAIYQDFTMIKSIKLRLDKPEILNNCIVGVEHFRKF